MHGCTITENRPKRQLRKPVLSPEMEEQLSDDRPGIQGKPVLSPNVPVGTKPAAKSRPTDSPFWVARRDEKNVRNRRSPFPLRGEREKKIPILKSRKGFIEPDKVYTPNEGRCIEIIALSETRGIERRGVKRQMSVRKGTVRERSAGVALQRVSETLQSVWSQDNVCITKQHHLPPCGRRTEVARCWSAVMRSPKNADHVRGRYCRKSVVRRSIVNKNDFQRHSGLTEHACKTCADGFTGIIRRDDDAYARIAWSRGHCCFHRNCVCTRFFPACPSRCASDGSEAR